MMATKLWNIINQIYSVSFTIDGITVTFMQMLVFFVLLSMLIWFINQFLG